LSDPNLTESTADADGELRQSDAQTEVRLSSSPLKRALWLCLGMLFLSLGMIGVLLPGLPTTPFMLLAAACFARSSQRFYSWLVNNPLFGDKVRRYRAGHGISPRIKLIAVSLTGLFVGYAALFGIPSELLFLRITVASIGVFGVWFILSRPTDRDEDGDRLETD
jgi:uncharacterized protein